MIETTGGAAREQSGGKTLGRWSEGVLPAPPPFGLRSLASLIGPGLLLASASIGTGEWLFGPAVTAQYGGTLLWLASVAIAVQVVYNLEVMRYALYCGEPIHVGMCRLPPAPGFWIACFVVLEFSNIWPFNASNAAVPLAAALLGHLPGQGSTRLLGVSMTESGLVKALGYAVLIGSFVPLIFGGKIYRMIERVMTVKLVLVLAFLSFVAVFMTSRHSAREVAQGFLRFGDVPLRAQSVIEGRHFTLQEREGGATYTVRGTVENAGPLITEFQVTRDGGTARFGSLRGLPPELSGVAERMIARAREIGSRGGFFVEDNRGDVTLRLEGRLRPDRTWAPERITLTDRTGVRSYTRIEDLPDALARRARTLVELQGVDRASIVRYWREQGRLPSLDWAMLAAFAAIAGAGGLTNSLFSNYARDKGWGMGALVGAIPSAVGGRTIALSHVGRVFAVTRENLVRWRGWMRHIRRDQVLWSVCCVLGMGFPCILSLEYIRNVPVSGNRVAALVADGLAARHPDFGQLLWLLTLFCSFLILAPGQILAGDQIARRWTDILWTGSKWAQRMPQEQVKSIYYGILACYAVWGAITLWFLDPLQIATISAVLMNVALGMTSLLTLAVNRTLLPPALRPGWIAQLGLVACALFSLGICGVVLATL